MNSHLVSDAGVQASGLKPNTLYNIHVHEGDCSNATSKHYQKIPGNTADKVSEIFLSAITSDQGFLGRSTVVNFAAGDTADSIVVHDGPNRICINTKNSG